MWLVHCICMSEMMSEQGTLGGTRNFELPDGTVNLVLCIHVGTYDVIPMEETRWLAPDALELLDQDASSTCPVGLSPNTCAVTWGVGHP